MKRRSAVFVGELISQAINNSDTLSKGMKEGDIMRAWREVAGELLFQYTAKLYIRNSTIYVQFSSASAKAEFFNNRHKILKGINEVAGDRSIKYISVIG